MREKNINWSTFKKYFKKKFLSEQYYEERDKEFFIGVIITSECIHLCILCRVPQCLFRNVSVM